MPRNPEANREYMRRYYQDYEQRKRGHRPRIDAETVRAHVNRCTDAHMTRQQIATKAGVAVATLDRLLRGETTSMRHDVARRILAVRPSRPVTPIGLTRRVRALAALGWTVSQIAEAGGLNVGTVKDYRKDGGVQVKRTALGIVDAYDKLSMRTPAAQSRYERMALTGARNRALKAGWAPPLAWDDDAIDDPQATPDTGARTESHTYRFDLDDWLMLVHSGETLERASERCGVTLNAVWTRARRNERDDVLAVLRQLREVAA